MVVNWAIKNLEALGLIKGKAVPVSSKVSTNPSSIHQSIHQIANQRLPISLTAKQKPDQQLNPNPKSQTQTHQLQPLKSHPHALFSSFHPPHFSPNT
ncbi:unnamed protein product [Citrullus colocynthis]|uniref:Uncharacterized protein n=1 Tax=Citrullus colocynthis TaxID=252529 RepID=A0ABP0Y4Y7_9ROSI